jgi:hypothetical protein
MLSPFTHLTLIELIYLECTYHALLRLTTANLSRTRPQKMYSIIALAGKLVVYHMFCIGDFEALYQSSVLFFFQ